jgi:hypothetical protein
MLAKRATASKQYYSGFISRYGQSSKWKISRNYLFGVTPVYNVIVSEFEKRCHQM